MKTTSFVVNVTSDQRDALIAFYRDVVQLAPSPLVCLWQVVHGPVGLWPPESPTDKPVSGS